MKPQTNIYTYSIRGQIVFPQKGETEQNVKDGLRRGAGVRGLNGDGKRRGG